MTTKTVTFQIDPQTGNLTCSPTVLHAERGDDITFRTEPTYPFAVVSKGLSPIETPDLRSTGQPITIKASGVPSGLYSLACAVCDVENGQIYMDPGCPSIIIGPRGA